MSTVSSLANKVVISSVGLRGQQGIPGLNADTGSLYQFTSSIQSEVDELTSLTGSYAITGSNSFVGSQTISGSLIVSGSSITLESTINAISSVVLTGSLLISGSTTIENDVSVTGSIEVSGSSNFTGNITGSSIQLSNMLTLQPIHPLPTSAPSASLVASGSGVNLKPYFYNGSSWTSLT